MTKLLVLSIGAVLAVLAPAYAVQAQSVLQVDGTVQGVDCAGNTLTLAAADGTHTFLASAATSVHVDSTASSVCALSQYIGSHAHVWLTASENQLLAGRVDVMSAPQVSGGVAINVVPGPYYPEPCYGPAYGPYGPYPDCGPYYDPYAPFGFGIDIGPGYYGPGYYDRDHRGHDHDWGHDRGSHWDPGRNGGHGGHYGGGGHPAWHNGGGPSGGFHGGGGSHGGGGRR
jgi:uncharacterized membrane protein YgcG